MFLFFHNSIFAHPTFSTSTNHLAHAHTLSRMSSLSGRMNIGWVNIEFFPEWNKITQRRIFFVLGYLRMILWKISTAMYLYGFLDQSLGLILGNICCIIKITAFMPLTVFRKSYFLPWAVLHKRFYGCFVNFAASPWKSTCCSIINQHTGPWCIQTYKLSHCSLK
jgi:hypothetical protein